MEFFHRAAVAPARLGILPGTFNPVTTAHLALAKAGLAWVDEVLFVLPRELPRKALPAPRSPSAWRSSGRRWPANRAFPWRRRRAGCSLTSPPSAAGSMAPAYAWRSCRARRRGADRRLGLRAARRIRAHVRGLDLLVASRAGRYEPPPEFRGSIQALELAGEYDGVSATGVRRSILRGEPGELMVPEAARELALRIYRGGAR